MDGDGELRLADFKQLLARSGRASLDSGTPGAPSFSERVRSAASVGRGSARSRCTSSASGSTHASPRRAVRGCCSRKLWLSC